MKTRPFGSVLMALFLCVALTACGTETPNPTPQESEITTTAAPTTTTTTTAPSIYDPYEDASRAPGKDKQNFLLDILGDEIVMTYDKTMIHPNIYTEDECLWYYNGTIPSGDSIRCRVNADTETIAYVECDIPQDSCAIKKEDAKGCKGYGYPYNRCCNKAFCF